jgi:AraC-like DNA-binding protein
MDKTFKAMVRGKLNMIAGVTTNRIKDSPIGIVIREIDYIAPHVDEDIFEIIMCLSGEVTISYFFEEFTLRAGEFILVDKDVHYLYNGNGALCVSFYIHLSFFKKKYPYIDSLYFVCEGTRESKVPFDTYNHKHLKAMLIALLTYLSDNADSNPEILKKTNIITLNIVDLLVDKFDITFWYHPDLVIQKPVLLRYRMMMDYIFKHHTECIKISSLAEKFNFSEVYISELLSSVSLGFRKMLNYNRVSHAARLLINTDMSILSISEACGFSDPKYLYKAFAEWYNCTPNMFRKQYLSEVGNEDIVRTLQLSHIVKPLEQMRKEHFIDWFM